MVRITLTGPQTALAGVALKISLVMFKASIAMFSEERALSRCFVRWGLEAMAGTRGRGEKATWRMDDKRWAAILSRLVQTVPPVTVTLTGGNRVFSR